MGEYFSVVTTFNILADKHQTFNCNKCIADLKKFESDEIIEKEKKRKHCTTIKSGNPIVDLQQNSVGFEYYTCVGNFYDKSVENLLSMAGKFEAGIMPYDGGLFDQPAKLVEALDLCQNLKMKHQTDMMKNGR